MANAPEKARITIDGRAIGPGEPVYIVAEMSANHNQSYDAAVRIIHEAKACGADAVKIQTYTPDTITLDADTEHFRIKGTIWEGETLYSLYGRAYTPWDWQPRLKAEAEAAGITLFSSPFDHTAVDFLEEMGMPAYKVASFELVDLPLIERIAATGKPVILSTGMAEIGEIADAVAAARGAGAGEIALLKCTSAYPAPPGEMNLRTIRTLGEVFSAAVGLSDHTAGIAVPVAAVAMGACIVEKHFTLSREDGGPDAAFSLEPGEFRSMVEAVRVAEQALGTVSFAVSEREAQSRVFRRSLFVVADVKAGEPFGEHNLRSIRPGHGLHPKYLKRILGKRATRDIPRGTPLSWDMVDGR